MSAVDDAIREAAIAAINPQIDVLLARTLSAETKAQAAADVVRDLAVRLAKIEALPILTLGDSTPGPTPAPTPPPVPVTPGVDWQGSIWTLDSAGRILRDGRAATNPDMTIDVVSLWVDSGMLFQRNKRGEVYTWSGQPDWNPVSATPAPTPTPVPTPDPAPTGATNPPAPSVTVSGEWEQRTVGSWAATNDTWNMAGWNPPLVLGQNLIQTVSIGQEANGRVAFNIRAEVPPGKGNTISEVRTYPHIETGQPPGLRNLGRPNLPIRIDRVQSIKAGALVTRKAVNGIGHLSHDMRLLDTADVLLGYWNAVPHILSELFVVVESWGGYGDHPNGRSGDKFRGTISIAGSDYHFYIQPGATNTPQFIWLPAKLPCYSLDMAPLFQWAARTRYADLPNGPGGIFERGRGPNDTIIQGSSFLTNDNIGVETVTGSFDVSGEAWFDVT